MTEAAVPLQELMQYITILVLDDEYQSLYSTAENLMDTGFQNVLATQRPEDALTRLSKIDILLTDQFLGSSPWDGLTITRKAKELRGNHLQVIIYSANVKEISKEAVQAGATAFIEKTPAEMEMLILWIKEVARRIWAEKILDALPDELVVLDTKDFGRIHFANKTKRDLYEGDTPLLCDHCFNRFEIKGKNNSVCPGCPSIQACRKDQTVRTEWKYISKTKEQKCSVDLFAAPLKDETGTIRAVIESCRDRTHHMIADEYINKIERAKNWEKRLSLFLEGFTHLGYLRARFYQYINKEGANEFKGIRSIGMPPGYDIRQYQYHADLDEPTRILCKRKKPTLFLVDYKNPDRDWVRDEVTNYLYKVGANIVNHNKQLRKNKWIELPIMAHNKIIAKVSLDSGLSTKDRRFISIYDLDILGHYATMAGQALYNAQQYAKTQMNVGTHKTIISISKDLTSAQFNLDLLKSQIVKRVCKVMNTAVCSIFLGKIDDGVKVLKRDHTYLIDKDKHRYSKIDFDEKYTEDESITGGVYLKEQNKIVNDLDLIAQEAREGKRKNFNLPAYDYYCEKLKEPIRNGMFAVLRTKRGKIGVLRTMNKRRQDLFGQTDFDDDDMVAFEALAGQIAVAIESGDMVEELKTLQAQKTDILENYTHTLKNRMQPLVTIAGVLEKHPEHQDQLWKLFTNELLRLGTAANSMLKLAQAEAEQLTIMPTEVDTAELVTEVVEPYKFSANDRGMKIKISLDPDAKIIIVDRQMMFDALANLVDNAVIYGYSNTIITVDVYLKKDLLYFSVKNFADPIPKEERKKMFEKYVRGKEVIHKIAQLGIGLAYVKVVAKSHNGDVFIDPSFKNGVKVVISLPRENVKNEPGEPDE